MAVDEWLMQFVGRERIPVLRFYGWEEPTLSLGYFQKVAEREGHLESQSAKWLRRATGGGAILHDRELTYSLALPIEDRVAGANRNFYDLVHDSLISALLEWGVAASKVSGKLTCSQSASDEASSSDSKAFLCFQRHCDGDVLVAGRKVGGSAQRRGHNTLLQHGSICLETSPFAPQILGIEQLSGVKVSPDQLRQELQKRILLGLNRNETDFFLDPGQLDSIESIERLKFANQEWQLSR